MLKFIESYVLCKPDLFGYEYCSKLDYMWILDRLEEIKLRDCER